MTIREYTAADKEKCFAIFDSNCPKFFDKDERNPFINWLDHQGNNEISYASPTYKNAEMDAYYVIETPMQGLIACGGFYITKETNEARLAWGMIHADFHKQGYGKALYLRRIQEIRKIRPNYSITLGTSQFTYPFYERMGMKVVNFVKSGYGPDLDRYDMHL